MLQPDARKDASMSEPQTPASAGTSALAEITASQALPNEPPTAPRWAKLLLLPAVVSMTVTLDQGTKLLAQAELAEQRTRIETRADGSEERVKEWRGTRSITVVPGFFNFRYVENPAAAFSLTSEMPENIRKPFLVAVSMLAMALIITWYWRTREPDWLILGSFAFILGGALGNLVDRMAYGYVIDFIDWHLAFFNPGWPHWPTFNIADSAICVGAAGVILRTFRPYQEPVKADAEKSWNSGEGIVDGTES